MKKSKSPKVVGVRLSKTPLLKLPIIIKGTDVAISATEVLLR